MEGLGALFSQGELSPFKDNAPETTEERAFCFSCGRTFEKGTKLCPYCGTRQ
ncbi:zinc-ribbon domain-containing protein [Candidatus Thorarchaeota archaeon]|nr:MAG: zinc-ribbon domain-containing protein [Candidatus Thorarchaeota archaeon]